MRESVEKIVRNCLNCIVSERKQGKQEGFLNVIDKGDVPLDTYHIDHVGPMTLTKKRYKHVLVVLDAFTKFVWVYPTRSVDSAEVIDRLSKQAKIFGNPRRIASDRGTAFTSKAFETYCKEQNIQHLLIATGLPRGNGQVERVNSIILPLLAKLSLPKSEEWYRHTDQVQMFLNATPSRSTKRTPFQLMFGINMKLKDDFKLRELIEEKWMSRLDEERNDLCAQAKQNILRIQSDNRRSYNKKRKEPWKYKEGDLVAIKRTQFGPGLKIYPKYFAPYEVVKVLRHDRYVVHKIGNHEGPQQTSTAADSMKPYNVNDDVHG